MREIDSDVVTNERDVRRLVILLMDDAFTGSEHGESTSARKIAHRIVDSLGPADQAGIVFTYDGRAQNLTADRTRLRAAVESYNPKLTPRSGPPLGCELKLGGCVTSALKQIGDMLRDAPEGRKMVMLIGSSGALNVKTDPFAQMTPVEEMFRALQRSSVTVYAFDPAGLSAPRSIGGKDLFHVRQRRSQGAGCANRRRQGPARARRPHVHRRRDRRADRPVHQHSRTGGCRHLRGEQPVLLVGFRSADRAKDGHLRRVQVKVNRPGAIVHTRIGYCPNSRGIEVALRIPRARRWTPLLRQTCRRARSRSV